MKRSRWFSLLLCLILAHLPISFAEIPSARPEPGTQMERAAKLYFRYRQTAYLGQEERMIFWDPATPFEKALTSALLDGPGSVSPQLFSLFPEGTKVLSTQGQNHILFITFNEQLLSPYADETALSDPAYREGEGRLRRRLAMASLTNTITENTSYAYVQVLIRREKKVTKSMRLPESYFLLDEGGLISPLPRDEEKILTPATTVDLLLSHWRASQRDDLMQLVHFPSGTELPERLALVTGCSISPGTISSDGKRAIILLHIHLQQPNGLTAEFQAWPLRLRYCDGQWKVCYESLKPLWEETP